MDTGTDLVKVFTASWGQLEKNGSNIGDEAIFASQVKDLSTIPDIQIGVWSAVPEKTRQQYGVIPFGIDEGRLKALEKGVEWADIVIVGGGELAQDRSSLLYTPFNLMPLRCAEWYGKKSFAWSVGIGQQDELKWWTPGQLKKWLGTCCGITVRDKASLDSLLEYGLSSEKVKLASDSTFTLASENNVFGGESKILGVAPRNVANRQGKLLPLEIRRKLGIYREPDVTHIRKEWACLLDRHLEKNGGIIHFFPFHKGSLSNSDDAECEAIIDLMQHRDKTKVVDSDDVYKFMQQMGQCRVFLTVPLHGAILSVVVGTIPVSIPYASKGKRFMEGAGLSELIVKSDMAKWNEKTAEVLDTAWNEYGRISEQISQKKENLIADCMLNRGHFIETCLKD